MPNPDVLFSELRKAAANNDSRDWAADRIRLQELVRDHLQESKQAFLVNKIQRATGGDKRVPILDYGCGGGTTVFYLLSLGYEYVRGVDVGGQEPNIKLSPLLGLGHDLFTTYDAKTLPYADETFGLIVSQQVLEHVHDLESYYGQAARVLKPGGLALLDFPHRLVPYDSHSCTWFIHWLPRSLRKRLHRLFGKNKEPGYYENILNLRTLRTHRRIARKHFSVFRVTTKERLRGTVYAGVYEGSSSLRKAVGAMFRIPVLGPVMLALFAQLAIADVKMVK